MNKRQKSEELWRQKFDEMGLAEKFELVKRDWESDHGKKAFVRCKTCGCVFETWNVSACFRRKVKGLTCPECGMKSDGTIQWTKSKICGESFDYYLQGHTVNEVSEKFGITVAQFDNERKARGITKTDEQRRKAWNASLKSASAKGNETQKMHARQKCIDHLDLLGFDYIGEDGKNGRVRCRKCKCEFERSLSHLRNGNVVCSECATVQKAEQEQVRKKEIQERKAKQEAERIEKNPLGLSSYQLSIREKYDAVRICEVCGIKYTIRDRMAKEGLKYCTDSGCCSSTCTKKKARIKRRSGGFRDNHRHRAKIYGCEYDGSVTLKKLIKRDGLRCALCGKMCNPNDHEWTKYFGPTYPTIDHIIPMSKGGGHVWDNVQVAHAICNSIKRDSIEVEAHEAS